VPQASDFVIPCDSWMPIRLLFPSGLPDDIGALKAALIAARAELATEKAKAMAVGAELARAGW
jgi:hypothetical protein